jgi:hypothetical protein
MVLEAWVPAYTLHQVATEFERGAYEKILLVRVLQEGEPGVFHGQYSTQHIAEALQKLGLPNSKIVPIYISPTRNDRTRHSALELREWLAKQGETVSSLDVVTLGPHSRRSRLQFQRAFGAGVRVGVISLADPSYDSNRWWESSAGVREVWGETLAYCYARLAWGER